MSLSFIDLNNQGVIHLRDGEYEEASRLFRKAFNTLKGTITRQAPRNEDRAATQAATAANGPETTGVADEISLGIRDARMSTAEFPAGEASISSSSHTASDQSHPARQTRKRKAPLEPKPETGKNILTNEVHSSKRARADVPARKRETNAQTLCRPLWLEPTEETQRSGEAAARFAPSILYNLAYSLHRTGTHRETCNGCDSTGRSGSKQGMYFLRQAMSFYTKVFQLCGKRRCPVVKWMCCHNLQQLLRTELSHVADCNKATKLARRLRNLETHKVLLLRARFSNGGSDQLFLSVLSFLGLGGIERLGYSPAAAA